MESVYQQEPANNHPNTEIPKALKDIPHWMGTRFKPRPGKPGKVDKPPYCVRPGQPFHQADKTDPDNWTTFDQALASLERGMDAIGFVFTGEDPFFCVDLDDVLDPEAGEIEPGAAEIIHTFGSYAEISCSGRGVHIIGAGTKPSWAGCRKDTLGFEAEVYDRARFVVITGEQMCERSHISECQGELEDLCKRLWPKQDNPASQPPNTGPVDLEDAVLLERARTSRSGPKFHKLYDLGDTSGFDSHSNADFALLNMLIFWCAGERERIISLFEASALYRQKEKHRGYTTLSVDNALASYKGSFYQVSRTRQARYEAKAQGQEDPLAPWLALMLDTSIWAGRKGASAYKAYCAAVLVAAKDGVVDDEGDLRIGCDVRRLAEVAGTTAKTLAASGLPHLIQKMKLLRWKKGKGTKAGVLVLKNPSCTTYYTRIPTHFSVVSCATPSEALKTLGLLIRMRYGHADSDTLLRLGMPAMFVVVALVASGGMRGYNLAELAEVTGRRKSTLDYPEGQTYVAKDKRRLKPPSPIKRLKAAGIIRERSDGRFVLTAEFVANYERHLEYSGITYAERKQKQDHERDRIERAKDLDKRKRSADKTVRLRGKDQVQRLLRKRAEQEKERHRASGQPTGDPDTDLRTAIERIEALVKAGMKRKFARMEVLAYDHSITCKCEVCG